MAGSEQMQLEMEKQKSLIEDKCGLDVLQEEIDLLRQDLSSKSARNAAPDPVKNRQKPEAFSKKGNGMSAKEKNELKEM